MKFLLSLVYSVPLDDGTRREFTVASIQRRKTSSLNSAYRKTQKAYDASCGYDWTGAEPVRFEQSILS